MWSGSADSIDKGVPGDIVLIPECADSKRGQGDSSPSDHILGNISSAKSGFISSATFIVSSTMFTVILQAAAPPIALESSVNQ